MRLLQALAAFYRALVDNDCHHPRLSQHAQQNGLAVSYLQQAPFCPDCGFMIQFHWLLARCRTCGARRALTQESGASNSQRFRSRDKYCKHCGGEHYRLIQKEQLHPHEVADALLIHRIAYEEQDADTYSSAKPNPIQPQATNFDSDKENPFRQPAAHRAYRRFLDTRPFRYKNRLDIIEGQAINVEETIL
jgi:Zn finger protein HypA/HybF involved in hydrogenase expression